MDFTYLSYMKYKVGQKINEWSYHVKQENLNAWSKILNDPTVGGLALDIRPSTTTFEAIDADQPAGVIFCEYEIDYRTAYNNLST